MKVRFILFTFFYFIETGLYVSEAGLEFTMQQRVASNLIAEITGVHYHVWFMWSWC